MGWDLQSSAGTELVGLRWAQPGSTGMAIMGWAQLDWARLGWTGLSWDGSVSLGDSWAQLGWDAGSPGLGCVGTGSEVYLC